MKSLHLLAVACLLSTASLHAEDPAAGKQVEQSFKSTGGITVPFLLSLPVTDAAKPPLMLFLHGRGESDGPLSIVAKWGPPRMAARGDKLPYILVSPQCPRASNWSAPEQQAALVELVDHIAKTYHADTRRLYLTGLSMGGYGSWRLAADHPEKFAAVAPICGAGNPVDGEKLTNVPIWAWHGTEDAAVPFQRSVEMVEAIKKAGGTKIRFTTLEHIGHNSWSAAYATPELFDWFNQHALPE
jgi:predicted peptidase